MADIETLRLLTAQMYLEPAEDTLCPQLSHLSQRKQDSIIVTRASLPNGKHIPLLKTLLSSVCERNCNYCPFRTGRDFKRATFSPDEFAHTFMALHQKAIVEGLFLSSGVINGGVFTQDKLIATAEILRYKLGFHGYLHLKIMPGAEKSQVERAMQLANRVSINLEAPNPKRLEQLAPHKQYLNELLQPLRWIDEIRRTQPSYKGWNGVWPSSVTQYVVGAAGDTDLELLLTTEQLYNQYHLKRAYYSAFNPIPDTPLENLPPTSPVREHRLYEASFLLRDYGFSLEDLPFLKDGNLPLSIDPKLAWARSHLIDQPIEVNQAEREVLLRIPGIGPKGANAVIKARRRDRIKDFSQLKALGINFKRAAPYILINGIRPSFQPFLFQ